MQNLEIMSRRSRLTLSYLFTVVRVARGTTETVLHQVTLANVGALLSIPGVADAASTGFARMVARLFFPGHVIGDLEQAYVARTLPAYKRSTWLAINGRGIVTAAGDTRSYVQDVVIAQATRKAVIREAEVARAMVGHYVRHTETGAAKFVLDYSPEHGTIQMRHMDGSIGWASPLFFSVMTEDEELAAAVEWDMRTGRLMDAREWLARIDADEAARLAHEEYLRDEAEAAAAAPAPGTYYTDRAGALDLLKPLSDDADVAIDQAQSGPAVYVPGYSVAWQPGRFNGQDYIVRITPGSRPAPAIV